MDVTKNLLWVLSVNDRINTLITEKLGVKGVIILSVERGSPAAKGGLRGTRIVDGNSLLAGDNILLIDDHVIEDTESLLKALDQYR